MNTRKIKKVLKSKQTIEGAGVYLKRAFGYSHVPNFDPFLMLDDFRISEPEKYVKGFPWHPHRGIETITYVLKGDVEHGDSLGNSGIISAGNVQWMTAGSGIIHQEMPKGDKDGKMFGFQIWANLPSGNKMMDPKYRDLTSSNIPNVELKNGINIKVICGNVGGIYGPVNDIIIDPEYLDITLPPDCEYIHETKKGYTVFTYIIEGKCYFCKEKNPFNYEIEGINYFDFKANPFLENENIVLFDDGDNISVKTENDSVRFLLLAGKPIKEPVAWYGPIVMNTQEELSTAFEELENGNFIK